MGRHRTPTDDHSRQTATPAAHRPTDATRVGPCGEAGSAADPEAGEHLALQERPSDDHTGRGAGAQLDSALSEINAAPLHSDSSNGAWRYGPVLQLLGWRGRTRRTQRFASEALAVFLGGATAGWAAHGWLDVRTDAPILAVGPDPHSGGLLKASNKSCGLIPLERQTRALATLHADARLGSWRLLLPRVLAAGEVNGAYCVLESRFPAKDGRRDLSDPDRRDRLVSTAVATITELGRRTCTHVQVTDRELKRWISEPIAQVRQTVRPADRVVLDRMERTLTARLAGRRLAAGWTHGDYHPGNVLTDDAGRIVAVVDWCTAKPDGMVILDVVNFELFTDAFARAKEFGWVVRAWWQNADSTSFERMRDAQLTLRSDVIDGRTLILLAWLHHISHFIESEPPGSLNPIWTRRNVRAVLLAWTKAVEGDGSL